MTSHSHRTTRPPALPAGTEGMVWVPGGTFRMGSDHHYPEEAPARLVTVEGFWMDAHAVTNRQFRQFVKATGYVTLAERAPNPADYPDANPELLVPASAVFQPPRRRVDLSDHRLWWSLVPGASWRRPHGPRSPLRALADHPVVHVAHEDVRAYASWAGKDLPTEAEWEYGARGGLDGATYAWGEELTPGGRHLANTWQGDFPLDNRVLDGHRWTAPVGSFPPNGYGLYEITGNVWEWTADRYQDPAAAAPRPCCGDSTPPGDPGRPGDGAGGVAAGGIPEMVIKGGSHLCAPNYCRRYRPAARLPQPVDTATCHLGFRCVVRPPTPAVAVHCG